MATNFHLVVDIFRYNLLLPPPHPPPPPPPPRFRFRAQFYQLCYGYLEGINDSKQVLKHKGLAVYRNKAQEPSDTQQRSKDNQGLKSRSEKQQKLKLA